MSTLIYNCIKIDIVQTLRYSRVPVFDGRTYLYTRHYIHIKGVVDPQDTGYDFTGLASDNVLGDNRNPGNAVAAARGIVPKDGNNANVSDTVIRHLLSQPKRKLLYAVDELGPGGAFTTVPPLSAGVPQPTLILQSPFVSPTGPQQYTADADYGPFPLKYDVWRVDGTGTFRVEFAVETFVNESHLFLTKPPILLSNEWEMDQDIDEHGFTAQHVRGRAKFNAAVLEQQQTSPDDYRDFILLPIPAGFQRKHLRVRAEDDGTTLDYQFVDQQMSHSYQAIRNMKFTKLEAFASITQGTVGEHNAVATAAGGIISAYAGIFSTAPVTNFINGVKTAGQAYLSSVPGIQASVTVRIWGSLYTERNEILRLADWITSSKLPGLFGKDKGYLDTGTNIQIDLLGRYVEVTKSLRVGALGKLVTNLGQIFGGYPELTTEDSIVVPKAISGLPKDTDVALVNNLALPVDLPDRRWLPGTAGRPQFMRLCMAAALSQWQNGPLTPPPAQRLSKATITPNY